MPSELIFALSLYGGTACAGLASGLLSSKPKVEKALGLVMLAAAAGCVKIAISQA